MELEGRTAIVTGSGRGIGRALALEFAREGASLVCCARRGKEIEETVSIIEKEGGSGLAIPCDVTKRAQVDALVSKALDTFGKIDVLFNNAAGFRALGGVWEVDPETWWADVTTNFLGPMLFSRAVLPSMMEQNAGVIINMNGGGATVPLPGGSGYGCSKAALMRFTETLAKELEREGYDILVLAIGPGLVHTETTQLQIDDARGRKWIPSTAEIIGSGESRPPEDCAKATVRMLRAARPEMNGRIFGVNTDFDEIVRRAAEIKEKDLHVMRLVD